MNPKRDESRIVLCGKGGKERKGGKSSEYDSGDDLDDEKYVSKKSNLKSKKPLLKSKSHGSKRKC